ncbi:major facilitator superfamily domain-containing protein [Calycina marina]|uniref:Major facilitator superfamily domain-containing protein n=1 Tax=Calycina marina TaxID=1763456 RepID=A0A9P7Z4U4_9HELO|nr:major facilitator superfamily domain-containing protein [Calycina marina]
MSDTSAPLAEHVAEKSNGVSKTQGNKYNEDPLQPSATRATYIRAERIASLSTAHQEYLLSRHGTFHLDPVPGFGNADPYNWPQWKKVSNLVLVAIHAMMSTFTAAAIIPAYQIIAEDLGRSLQDITYLTSLQIAILGVAPLFWKPIANHYGRRPVFLLSLIVSLAANIGCAKSSNYGSMAACRAIVAFFISPAAAIGSAVVTETFFKKERARYIGVWTLLITLGIPVSPFVMGFVANGVGYRWIYWILAMINGVQFVLYLFLGPETRFIRMGADHEGSDFKQEYMSFKRIDPMPIRPIAFIQPLSLFAVPCVVIPSIAYSMVFLWASVLITVELPQLFGEKFQFNPQQLGLQFLGIIIGSVIGEQIGGILSDYWMNRRAKTIGRKPRPEFRLWLSYPGFILSIVGVVVFLIQTNNAPELHWNISPVIGIAIAGVGNQIVTTVLITYAIDSEIQQSASVGVFVTFVRQIWGFIGPFWFPDVFTNVGLTGTAGIMAGLIIGVSILPTILIQMKGYAWRRIKVEEEEDVVDRPNVCEV